MKPAIFVVRIDDATTDSEFVYRTITYDKGHRDFDTVLQQYVSQGAVRLAGDQIVAVGGRRSLIAAFGHIPIQGYTFSDSAGKLLHMTTSRSAPARGKVVDNMLTDAGNFFLGPVTHLVSAVEKHQTRTQQVANAAAQTGRANYNVRPRAPVPGAPPLPAPPPPQAPRVPGVGYYYERLMNGTYNPAIIHKKLAVYEEGLKEKTVIRIIPAAANFNGIQLGPSITGSGICLRLRQHFDS